MSSFSCPAQACMQGMVKYWRLKEIDLRGMAFSNKASTPPNPTIHSTAFWALATEKVIASFQIAKGWERRHTIMMFIGERSVFKPGPFKFRRPSASPITQVHSGHLPSCQSRTRLLPASFDPIIVLENAVCFPHSVSTSSCIKHAPEMLLCLSVNLVVLGS
jgi:hypothetical protein